ncbi:tetratricopeptide repeat protein, partial [bacterium]
TRAKEFYIKALTLDPDDFTANYMLGSLLDQTGQLDEAKIYLERVTRIKPTLKLEFYPVAHAWEMLGDKEKALFYYRKALELNPESDRIKQKVTGLENQLRPQISPSAPPR